MFHCSKSTWNPSTVMFVKLMKVRRLSYTGLLTIVLYIFMNCAMRIGFFLTNYVVFYDLYCCINYVV